MNADRMMVAQAVLEGKIGIEHLTSDEAIELAERAVEMAIEVEIEKAAARGCNAFYGFEYDLVH